MFKFLALAHSLLFRLCWWLLKQPFRAIWTVLVTLVAWMGEEFRRWTALLVSGALIVLAGKAALNYAPPEFKQPLAMTVLALLAIWALAVKRSASYTLHNNLRSVRQRQYFRQLSGEISTVRRSLTDGLARATKDTPVGGAFRSNREDRVAAEERAERARRQAEAEERRRDELADLEPSPY